MVEIIEAFGNLSGSHLVGIIVLFIIIFNATITFKHKNKKDIDKKYTYRDLKWVFEQGIHEGILREKYKNNNDNDFIKSNLDDYLNDEYE